MKKKNFQQKTFLQLGLPSLNSRGNGNGVQLLRRVQHLTRKVHLIPPFCGFRHVSRPNLNDDRPFRVLGRIARHDLQVVVDAGEAERNVLGLLLVDHVVDGEVQVDTVLVHVQVGDRARLPAGRIVLRGEGRFVFEQQVRVAGGVDVDRGGAGRGWVGADLLGPQPDVVFVAQLLLDGGRFDEGSRGVVALE